MNRKLTALLCALSLNVWGFQNTAQPWQPWAQNCFQRLKLASAASGSLMIGWPSTNASIPSGWSRETSLDDGIYLQVAPTAMDADLTTERGSTFHGHTSPSHAPAPQTSHAHDFTLSANSDSDTSVGNGATSLAAAPHGHAGSTELADAESNGFSITVNNQNNTPDYTEIIWISKASVTGIPNGAYAFYESDTLPGSWSRVLGNQYIRGPPSGGDAGSTGGDSGQHLHVSPEHVHTQDQHTHPLTASSTADASQSGGGASGDQIPVESHVHDMVIGNTVAVNQGVTTTISNTSTEPLYKKLNIVSNGTGADSLPTGIMALWTGAHSNIPDGWERASDFDGYFIKGAATNGESTVTIGGSSAAHNHTASNCDPIQDAHTHSCSQAGSTNTTTFRGSGSTTTTDLIHVHTCSGGVTTAVVGNNAATVVTINNSSTEAHYPPYRRVILVRKT